MLSSPPKGVVFKPLLKAFKKTLKTLLKNKNYTAEDITQYTDLVGATYDSLQKAITPEIVQQIPATLTQSLDDNIFLFSGLKTHAQLTEASKLLKDTNGNIKSQEQFTREFTQLYGKYNQQYLQSEYAFAQQSVLSASRWSQFDDEPDFMLQYRTAGDERVRSAHQSLHNTTLPKNDPFWQSFTPPNGWRCRCTVVQVNADKYQKSDPEHAQKLGEQATLTPNKNGINTSAIFRFNPGTDKIVFPKNHPYSRVKDSSKAISLLKKDTEKKDTMPRKDTIKSISKEVRATIPQHEGLVAKGNNFATGKMITLRRSIDDIISHAYEDDNIINYVKNTDFTKLDEWKHKGWAPPQKKKNGERKHPEAYYFNYYEVPINGKTYYANVKMHKKYNSEILYTIESKKPEDLIKGKFMRKQNKKNRATQKP